MSFLPNYKFIWNIVLVGKQKLQSISTFLYNIKITSHVKKLPFRPYMAGMDISSFVGYDYKLILGLGLGMGLMLVLCLGLVIC